MSQVEWLDRHWSSEVIITVKQDMRNSLVRLFDWTPRYVTKRYRGSGTVWHDADTGNRCPTWLESQLADIWTKANWERKDAKRNADKKP